MAQLYSVTTGLTATAAAGTIKVAVQLALPSTQDALLVGFDVSFDGTVVGLPNLVELVAEAGVSSGGSAYTALKYGIDQGKAALVTARINDTTDGSTPVIRQAWKVSNTGEFSYLWPLGREFFCPVSTWLALRITVPTGGTIGNYLANVIWEE